MGVNEELKNKLCKFNLKVKTVKSKNRFHVKSINNIANSLTKYNTPEVEKLIILLLEYFEKINITDYSTPSKQEAHYDFKNYIFPSVLYLIKKEQYRLRSTLKVFIAIGLIIDLCIYFFIYKEYYYPIFSILFLLNSTYKTYVAKKEGRFASMYW
ncbi:hypothetical protein SCB49_06562 [unidentified eubacterium SCB49]|nr:hypothetical protein SCB49_06562 [unidentified eubacterium SCB49]